MNNPTPPTTTSTTFDITSVYLAGHVLIVVYTVS